MKNRTLSISVSAARDVVFAFLSQVENLPVWAPALCSGLRRQEGYWKGETPAGEVYFAIVADAPTGVIDLLMGTHPDQMTVIPFRVLAQPHGAAVVGTFFQPVDWADEMYELYYDIMLISLRGLVARFHGGELHVTGSSAPFYPSLVTARFYETWDFYTAHLGFRTVCATDLYVQLAHAAGAQIGILRHELDVPTPELVSATDGRGFWLNLDIPDADAEFARLSTAGVEIASPLEDKPWGDRQFVVRDPNGVLIAIAHRAEIRGTETRPLAH